MTDEKRVQHIAGPVAGLAVCGAILNPNMAGLVATCERCWDIHREERRGRSEPAVRSIDRPEGSG